MKPTTLTATLLSMVLSLSATAQDPVEKKPVTPPATESETKPADPFVKKKDGEKAKEEATGLEKFVNVGSLFQYIDVKRERWQKWLAENETPLDAGALRKEVEGWLTTGEAELAETSLVMGKSGQRSKVESIRVVFYPTSFDAVEGGMAFPRSFEARNVGTTTEVDPIFNLEGRVEMNFAPERVRYLNENPPRVEAGVAGGDIRWPFLQAQKITCSITLGADQWGLIGSEDSFKNPELYQTLIFVRPAIHQFEDKGTNGPLNGEAILTLHWLEVSSDFLNKSIMRDTNLSDLIGGALHRLIIEKGSTISLQRVIRIKSGQRNKIESIREVIYPGLFTSGDDGYATPTAHETRNLGTTVEVDPVFNDKGTVLDLDLSPEQVSHFGESIHHRILIGGEWKPNVTMPVFYTMKTTTQVTLPLDTYVLVSVMSPPDAEGRTDASRKVLLFVKVSR